MGGWELDGGVYGWVLWVQGDATVNNLNFDVYADPIDLIDALDGPIIMANLEAKKGPIALYGDVVYAQFAGDQNFLVNLNPIGNLTLNGNARVGANYTFGIYEGYAFYQVAGTGPANNTTTLELGGGARAVQQNLDVTLGIDLTATRHLGKRLNVLENRINKIQNRQQRIQALQSFNALRQALLNQKIINAESSRILTRRANRLERRLNRVTRRGDVIAAINALENFRLALLHERVSLANADVHGNLAFARSGSMDWTDPVVGGWLRHEFTKGEAVSLMGDVGGFDAGSDFTWEVVLNYERDTTLFGYDIRCPSATRRWACSSKRGPAKARAASMSSCTGRSPS